MQESLACGKEDHDLEETKFLRVKLLKVAENVSTLSKRIELLNTDQDTSPENMPSRYNTFKKFTFIVFFFP